MQSQIDDSEGGLPVQITPALGPVEIEMLAWLDYTLKTETISFKATVAKHINKKLKERFTSEDLDRKLRNIWRRFCGRVGQPIKDLESKGSIALHTTHGLSDTEKTEILVAVHSIEDEALSTTKRVTRNRVSVVVPSFNPPNSKETVINERGKKRKINKSATPSCELRKESILTASSSSTPSRPSKKQRTPIKHIGKLLLDRTNPTDMDPDGPGSNRARTTRSATLVPKGEPPFELIDLRLESALSENGRLRNKVSWQCEEIDEQQAVQEDLEGQISELNEARRARELESGQTLEGELAAHIRKINKLKAELRERRKGHVFTGLQPVSQGRFEQDMVTGLEGSYFNSKQILFRSEDSKALLRPDLRKHENLRSLLMKMLGMERKTRAGDVMHALSALSLQALIRGLANMALQEWVFETDFPYIHNESSRVLSEYRNVVAKQDGLLALRNLDLAVTASLIRVPSFEATTIREEGTQLAIKFSQLVAPLFTSVPSSVDFEGFHTWNKPEEHWKEQKSRLIDMFSFALTTKARSCLNIENYEMVIYPPGSRFHTQTMETETMDGMEDVSKNKESREVVISLQAALFAYPRKPVTDTSTVEEMLVPMRNFVVRSEQERGGIKPLMKAVVVLGPTEEL